MSVALLAMRRDGFQACRRKPCSRIAWPQQSKPSREPARRISASFAARSPGEGRVLLCMQAHDDQLGIRCQFALYRASRHLERAINRVGTDCRRVLD